MSDVPTVRVIGCGNPDVGDDAAGLLAVREAGRSLAAVAGVDVVEAGPAGRVVDLLQGVDAAVVVDAVRTRGGRPAGEIVRIEVSEDELPSAELSSALSSHGVGLAEAVGIASALGRAPRLVFLGIEVGRVVVGGGLSTEVRRTIPLLAAAVESEVRDLLEEASR